MKRILSGVFVVGVLFCQAQDMHFSQVYNNPLFVNPANVGGFKGYERVILNYRSQWMGTGKYNTMGFSYDMPVFQKETVRKSCLGFGVSVFNDRAGTNKMGTTLPALTLGAIVPTSANGTLTFAMQAGYLMRSVNLNSATWSTQFNGKDYDPSLPSQETFASSSAGAFDMGAGMRYAVDVKKELFQGFNVAKWDIGIGAYHITRPTFNFLTGGDKMYVRWTAQTSARFDLPKANVGFIPYFVMFMQGPNKEINGGLMARFRLREGTKITGLITESALSFGLHYRADDAIVPQVMFEYGPWAWAVAYDLTTSNFRKINNLNGGFEVSMRWNDLKGVVFKKRTTSNINN
jgi:type IX secretion system PorP/SprF family membrane protein